MTTPSGKIVEYQVLVTETGSLAFTIKALTSNIAIVQRDFQKMVDNTYKGLTVVVSESK